LQKENNKKGEKKKKTSKGRRKRNRKNWSTACAHDQTRGRLRVRAGCALNGAGGRRSSSWTRAAVRAASTSSWAGNIPMTDVPQPGSRVEPICRRSKHARDQTPAICEAGRKFLGACSSSDYKRRGRRTRGYRLLPVFSELLKPDCRDGPHIARQSKSAVCPWRRRPMAEKIGNRRIGLLYRRGNCGVQTVDQN